MAAMLRDVVVGRTHRHPPASHGDYEKRGVWFSISKHASGSVPIFMVLCLSAHRADGAPLL